MSHLHPTRNGVINEIFRLICFKDVFVEFSWPIRIEIACFSCVLVHKKFKNHLYGKSTRISGLQTGPCPGVLLTRFRHENSGPNQGITVHHLVKISAHAKIVTICTTEVVRQQESDPRAVLRAQLVGLPRSPVNCCPARRRRILDAELPALPASVMSPSRTLESS